MKRSQFLFFALFSALVSIVPTAVAAAGPRQQEAGHGPVLCYYAGKPLYASAAAGVSYARGLKIFRAAYKRWGPGDPTRLWGKFPLEGTQRWPQAHRALYVYTECLNGIIARYIRYKLVQLIGARCRSTIAQYVNPADFLEAMRQQAKLDHLWGDIEVKGMEGGWGALELIAQVRRAFPRLPAAEPPIMASTYWPSLLANRAFYLSVDQVFPKAVHGEPSGLQRWDFNAGMAQFYIGVIYDERKAFFVKLTNSLYGKWHFFVATGAYGGGRTKGALRAFVSTALHGREASDAFVVQRADFMLRAMGSPTQMASGLGSEPYLRLAIAADRKAALRPQRLMAAQCPPSEQPGLFCMYGTSPTGPYRGRVTGPGSFVFGTAEDYIIPPAIADVLGHAKAGPGFRLPTAHWLRSSSISPLIGTDLGGTPIPKFYIRFPWHGGATNGVY